tara:strand:+ start:380 stop:820 length:441 start_codon:yes stop_codon:yes gene_type:complete
MIDTDKYEGHAKGNWNWGKQGTTDNGDGTIMVRPFTQLESKSGVTLLAIHHGDAKQPDLKLIADAPDLLAEILRLQSLLRGVGLCNNCGQSHEGIETVMDYLHDEVGHKLLKEHMDICHPEGTNCCHLCLCLNGFTIEHDYWEEKK